MPFHSTMDLIMAIQNGSFPEQVMLTVHPQRWEEDWWPWLKELIGQSIKNPLKRMLVRSTDYTDYTDYTDSQRFQSQMTNDAEGK
jgi:hypothetical protein